MARTMAIYPLKMGGKSPLFAPREKNRPRGCGGRFEYLAKVDALAEPQLQYR